jgi:predicted ATPase
MIHRRQEHTQFILATQSPAFADFFELEEVVTVLRKEGKSVFARQSTEALGKWLEEYSVGQLWRKNVIRGGITNG